MSATIAGHIGHGPKQSYRGPRMRSTSPHIWPEIKARELHNSCRKQREGATPRGAERRARRRARRTARRHSAKASASEGMCVTPCARPPRLLKRLALIVRRSRCTKIARLTQFVFARAASGRPGGKDRPRGTHRAGHHRAPRGTTGHHRANWANWANWANRANRAPRVTVV